MSYKILIGEQEILDAFDIRVKLGINKLQYASFGLPNPKGEYNEIKLHDALEVWLGDPLTKFFVGKN